MTAPPPPKARSNGAALVGKRLSAEPVCPQGQIPATIQNDPALIQQNSQTGARPLKGNPLLRPQSNVGPQLVQPGGAPLAYQFDEIYGQGVAPRSKQMPAPPSANCLGKTYGTDPTCYYYGSAGISRDVIGGGMMISVNRPQYVGKGGPGHTLDEISMQGGVQNGNIVEVGRTISTDQTVIRTPTYSFFIGPIGTAKATIVAAGCSSAVAIIRGRTFHF